MLRGSTLRLLQTSSFRLALQITALSTLGALLVFVLIYQASQDTVRGALDNNVTGETTDIVSDIHDDHKAVIDSVRDAIAESAGTFYALIGQDHVELAGNIVVTRRMQAAWKGWQTLDRQDGLDLPGRITAIRGLATQMPNSEVLYVAENASSLHALDHLIVRTFLAVFGAILALGLAGGLLVARGTFRRVEAISKAARDIIHGDFSRRIDVQGNGDEFDRLADNLNSMLERIQNLMENIKQVSSDIAHDLRSPLARLREHLELSRKRSRDPDTCIAFDESIVQVDSALSIFAAMLRIAEIEAGARRRDFKRLDLTRLLQDLADTFETVADCEEMILSADITPDLQVMGDQELLTQMFVNVIENAIRHTPSGSHISLAARSAEPAQVDVTIADDGPGIPAAEFARVMRRFVRLDRSRHSPGSGLGLPLAAAVAELHHGSIKLRDNAPGLRVSVLLHRVT